MIWTLIKTTRMPRAAAIGFAFFCAVLAAAPLGADVKKGAGYDIFTKAYKLEKTGPHKAIPNYYKALAWGLDKKYSSVALWRLKNLHRKRKEPDFELHVTRRLMRVKYSKKLKEDRDALTKRLKKRLNVSDPELETYLKGLASFYTNPKLSRQNWKLMLDSPPESTLFYDRALALLNRIDKKDQTVSSVSFLKKIRPRIPADTYYLRLLELEYGLGRYNEAAGTASEILQEAASGDFKLTAGQNYQLFFILGKVFQKKGKFRQAYLYFRLAGNHAYDPKGAVSLAAYMQFLNGRERLALSILDSGGKKYTGLAAILHSVLRYKINKDQAARKYLRDNRAEIRARYKSDKTKLLKQALKFGG